MSTLISSAVSGKKTAPKGAPRRRPPPQAGVAKQSTPVSVSSNQTSVAPPSPPPTQPAQTGQSSAQAAATPPVPTSPVQSRSQSLQRDQPRGPTAIRTPTPIAIPTATRAEQSPTQDEELPSPPSPQVSKKRKGDQAAAKAPVQPAKRVKRSSARSNAKVQAHVNNEETPVVLDPALRSTEPTVSASPAPAASVQKPKRARKGGRKAKARVADAGADDPQHDLELLDQQLAARKPKRRRRKKAAAPAESSTDNDARQGTDGEEEQSEAADEESDPELHEIDANTVTMFEVSHNKKYGMTSEREKKMAQIDWHEVSRKRREENDRIVTAAQQPPTNEEVRQTTEGPGGTAEPLPPPPEGTATVGGVRFRVVNGQIVEDETSLTIDRQAQAHGEAEDNETVEEESDLTQRINQATWLNDRRRDVLDRVPAWKRKSDPWTEEETDRFYDCLATFGTDFFIISTLFAPKTRRQIKTKFTREEKLDPKRINDALLGRKGTHPTTAALSLENYAREVGRDVSEYMKFENAEHAEEVIRESMREKEQEMRDAIRDEEAQEEAAREAEAVKERRKKKAAERKEGKATAKERRGAVGRRGGRRKGVASMGGGVGEEGGGGGVSGD